MGRRAVFKSKEIRYLFFQKVMASFDSARIADFRLKFNIPKSTFELYRNGNLTLPEELYLKLSANLQKSELEFFKKHTEYFDSNWGRIKAGKSTYSQHKSIFDGGRIKAIEAIRNRAAKFDINLPLTSELAYFMGLFIGDGFTNKYKSGYIVQFTGEKKEEQFYKTLISDYCKKLFDISPKIRYDNFCNAIRVNLYSRDLFNLITQRFKISAGRKSRTVLIPEEISKAKPAITKACLRGLYDAEGCIFFDKRDSYKNPYPRIELHMCNLELLHQVFNFLDKFGIKSKLGISEKNLRVTIWGFDEVRKFVREIGFSNPKQLEKLRNF